MESSGEPRRENEVLQERISGLTVAGWPVGLTPIEYDLLRTPSDRTAGDCRA